MHNASEIVMVSMAQGWPTYVYVSQDVFGIISICIQDVTIGNRSVYYLRAM